MYNRRNMRVNEAKRTGARTVNKGCKRRVAVNALSESPRGERTFQLGLVCAKQFFSYSSSSRNICVCLSVAFDQDAKSNRGKCWLFHPSSRKRTEQVFNQTLRLDGPKMALKFVHFYTFIDFRLFPRILQWWMQLSINPRFFLYFQTSRSFLFAKMCLDFITTKNFSQNCDPFVTFHRRKAQFVKQIKPPANFCTLVLRDLNRNNWIVVRRIKLNVWDSPGHRNRVSSSNRNPRKPCNGTRCTSSRNPLA